MSTTISDSIVWLPATDQLAALAATDASGAELVELHRVGAGLAPDLNRGRVATTISMLRRNGRASFGRRRGL